MNIFGLKLSPEPSSFQSPDKFARSLFRKACDDLSRGRFHKDSEAPELRKHTTAWYPYYSAVCYLDGHQPFSRAQLFFRAAARFLGAETEVPVTEIVKISVDNVSDMSGIIFSRWESRWLLIRAMQKPDPAPGVTEEKPFVTLQEIKDRITERRRANYEAGALQGSTLAFDANGVVNRGRSYTEATQELSSEFTEGVLMFQKLPEWAK